MEEVNEVLEQELRKILKERKSIALSQRAVVE
jgi:hypothetical protein